MSDVPQKNYDAVENDKVDQSTEADVTEAHHEVAEEHEEKVGESEDKSNN